MSKLKHTLIRLGDAQPALRPDLLPILNHLDKEASVEGLTEENLVNFLEEYGEITVNETAYSFGVSSQVVTGFFRKLVNKGVLVRDGRVYKLARGIKSEVQKKSSVESVTLKSNQGLDSAFRKMTELFKDQVRDTADYYGISAGNMRGYRELGLRRDSDRKTGRVWIDINASGYLCVVTLETDRGEKKWEFKEDTVQSFAGAAINLVDDIVRKWGD